MSDPSPAITPDLKISELLAAYPDLEAPLIEIAPPFDKLRNPTLRNTVAKVTTLRQAAKVGGVSLGDMISKLRHAAGHSDAGTVAENDAPSEERPPWLEACTALETYDAREAIEAGEHPLPQVMAALGKLADGQGYAIVTPFVPAPMVERVRAQGFQVWTERKEANHFVTYFAH
jgi:hypothetical protein